MAEAVNVIELRLAPGQVDLLRRLLRSPGDHPADVEVSRLRRSVDELSDELAELRGALDDVKSDVKKLAAIDPQWEAVARATWPDEYLAPLGHTGSAPR